MTTIQKAVQAVLESLGTHADLSTVAQLEALHAAGLPTPVSGDATTIALSHGLGAPQRD